MICAAIRPDAIGLDNPQGASVTWFGHDPSKMTQQIPIGVAVTLPLGAIASANLHLRHWLGSSVSPVFGLTLSDQLGIPNHE